MRLGVGSGIVIGFEVDTAFFSGNHAPAVSVQGIFAPGASGVPTGKVCLHAILRLTFFTSGKRSSPFGNVDRLSVTYGGYPNPRGILTLTSN